jgi:CheY-like chemotaxis protein
LSLSELAGLRVLIVEDEAMIAMLLEDQLDELGCVPIGPATSVRDALARVEAESIDAAVLDLNLRGARSYPVAEALAARGLPFLFITGYGQSGLDPQYQNEPVLQKPFTSDALAHARAALVGAAVPPKTA